LSDRSVLRVRLGHGANCSSLGSLVDTMFAMATLGGAVLASVVAAMGAEPVRVVGGRRAPDESPGEPPEPQGTPDPASASHARAEQPDEPPA
jgi:hypothetical protein